MGEAFAIFLIVVLPLAAVSAGVALACGILWVVFDALTSLTKDDGRL